MTRLPSKVFFNFLCSMILGFFQFFVYFTTFFIKVTIFKVLSIDSCTYVCVLAIIHVQVHCMYIYKLHIRKYLSLSYCQVTQMSSSPFLQIDL